MPYYFFFIGLVGNTLCDEAVNVKRRSKIFFLSLNFPFSFFVFSPLFANISGSSQLQPFRVFLFC